LRSDVGCVHVTTSLLRGAILFYPPQLNAVR